MIENIETVNFFRFRDRLIAFRQWMKNLGPSEQAKPLWITEYGSLFRPDNGISEQQTAAFMEATFNYMLGPDGKDPRLGYAPDEYRLVQKWMWYSLNGPMDAFGGTLINPQTNMLTTVGNRFVLYNPSSAIVPVSDPDLYLADQALTVAPGFNGHYQVRVKVGNHVSSDRMTTVKVDMYLGGVLVGSGTGSIPRCGGVGTVNVEVSQPLQSGGGYTFTAQAAPAAGNGTDLDPSNNGKVYAALTVPGFLYTRLPVIFR